MLHHSISCQCTSIPYNAIIFNTVFRLWFSYTWCRKFVLLFFILRGGKFEWKNGHCESMLDGKQIYLCWCGQVIQINTLQLKGIKSPLKDFGYFFFVLWFSKRKKKDIINRYLILNVISFFSFLYIYIFNK